MGIFGKKRLSAGVIGLGIIGTRIAAHLRAAGFTVPVWNRTPKTEPNFLGSPAEVASAADIIQLFVADPQAVYDVIEAMGEALNSRHTLVCSATIGRAATLEAARRVRERGARFLDAPFTGTKGAAEKGQLVYYIGDDDNSLTAARPVLEAASKAIVPVGKVGDAALVKVATNVMVASTVQTLTELLTLLKAAGLPPEVMGPALENHGIRSPLVDLKLPKLLEGDFEPHFALKHMLKDMRFGLDLAAELNLDLPITRVTTEALQDADNQGLGELDFAAVIKRYQ